MKKVSIGAKPPGSNNRLSPDAWVNDQKTVEKMKRFTIDVPFALHKRIKSQCALQGVNMADVIRELLEKDFPEEYQQGEGASLRNST